MESWPQNPENCHPCIYISLEIRQSISVQKSVISKANLLSYSCNYITMSFVILFFSFSSLMSSSGLRLAKK